MLGEGNTGIGCWEVLRQFPTAPTEPHDGTRWYYWAFSMSIFENMSDVCHTSTQSSVCIESTPLPCTELSAQSALRATPLPSTELMTLKGDGTYLKVTKISRDKDNEERRAWVVSRLSFGGQGSWYCLQPTQQNKSKCLKMISVIWGKFTFFSIIAHENTRVILPTSPSSESLSFSSLFSFFPSIFDLCCEGRGFLGPWFSFGCDREMQAQAAGMRNEPSVF